MYEAGASGNVIAVKLKIRQTTIYNVFQRYRQRGSIQTAKRPGRPRKLTDRDLRELGRIIQHLRKMKAPEICNLMLKEVSTRTIRQKAHEMVFFFSRVAAKKPFINEDQRKRRLTFARDHQHWTINNWKKVIWTNESSFEIGKQYQQVMVWRTTREKVKSSCLVPTFKSGRSSIMVWGAFIGERTSPLVIMPPKRRTAKDFIEIVYEGAWPMDPKFRSIQFFFLIKDGAPVHKAKISEDWRHSNNIKKTRLASPVPRPQSDRESLEKF